MINKWTPARSTVGIPEGYPSWNGIYMVMTNHASLDILFKLRTIKLSLTNIRTSMLSPFMSNE